MKFVIILLVFSRSTQYGGIAQLGERLNGIQEVSGSIPLISTKSLENLVFSRLFIVFLKNFPFINPSAV